MRRIHLLLAACLLLTAAAAEAGVSGSGAVAMTFDTSVRAEAMGSAGAALWWGQDTDHWANPALLSGRSGLQLLDYESQLAAGLADDIFLTDRQLTLGFYGMTLLLACGPLEGTRLDLGQQIATDENGNEIGVFESYQRAVAWGFGLDLVRAAELIRGHSGDGRGPWSRYVALGVGAVWKSYWEQMAPDALMDPYSGHATGNCVDLGLAVRVTPLDLTRGEGLGGSGVFGLRAGAAYGRSTLCDTDEFLEHVDAMIADPLPRQLLSGWSLHAEFTLTEDRAADLDRRFLGGFLPLVSLTYSRQTAVPGIRWTGEDYLYERDDRDALETSGNGWELGLANLLFIRRGHIEYEVGDLDGDTEGWGLNLQAGRLGGFRWNQATVPQAAGLPTVEREGWQVWLDPLEIARFLRD